MIFYIDLEHAYSLIEFAIVSFEHLDMTVERISFIYNQWISMCLISERYIEEKRDKAQKLYYPPMVVAYVET